VNNLAVGMLLAGRRSDSVALAREASALYHDLARTDMDVFGPAAELADGLVTALGEEEL
jgi:hypothetical protein